MNGINLSQQLDPRLRQSVQQNDPAEQAPPSQNEPQLAPPGRRVPEPTQNDTAVHPPGGDGALWDAAAAAGNTVEGFGQELSGFGHLAAASGLVAAAIFSWFGEGTQRAPHDTSSRLFGAANEQVEASQQSTRSAWASYGSAARHVGRIAQGAVAAVGAFLFGR